MLRIRGKNKIEKQKKEAKRLTILFDKSCESCITQDCYNCKIYGLFEKKIKKVIN